MTSTSKTCNAGCNRFLSWIEMSTRWSGTRRWSGARPPPVSCTLELSNMFPVFCRILSHAIKDNSAKGWGTSYFRKILTSLKLAAPRQFHQALRFPTFFVWPEKIKRIHHEGIQIAVFYATVSQVWEYIPSCTCYYCQTPVERPPQNSRYLCTPSCSVCPGWCPGP